MSHAQSDCVCPENPGFIYRLACNVYNLDRYVKANPEGILGEVKIFFLSFLVKSKCVKHTHSDVCYIHVLRNLTVVNKVENLC